MAQLVEWSLPLPDVRGSNPAIVKIYIEHLFTCLLSTVLKKRKEREKRGLEWPTFFIKNYLYKVLTYL